MKMKAVLSCLVIAMSVTSALALGPARDFGKLSDGRETKLWRLANDNGFAVEVCNYGGRVVKVIAPDRNGKFADVTLGFNSAAEYEQYGCCIGTLIGRFGNRIKDGRFTLDGKTIELAVNEKTATRNNNLHSGPKGWDDKIWKVIPFTEPNAEGLELSIISEDGDMGFPGRVECKVTYRVLKDANTFLVSFQATTDATTVINPTLHGYWNLAGEASGDVLAQELQIFANEYTEVDAGLIPVKNMPVANTGFDFTNGAKIGGATEWMNAQESLKAMGNWYDHNFVLSGQCGILHQAVVMRDEKSGRRMEIVTTEPCLQVYGAQDFNASIPTKTDGVRLVRFAGVALETQHFPDSPNHPEFPSTVLRPGEAFRSRTEYRFSVE